MPLSGTEGALGAKLKSAAKSVNGDSDIAWDKVAEAILLHISGNALVIGVAPPNGGPIVEGKIQ
ncbi:MAG TPA: hypothetical protein VFO10_01620 [Oligoflexus sp.]|uniref:hypothetical protein n=1 Tax=Oligoflexus sp. TaxID=1971216 RepID=UPI002D80B77E|nr:hypothetical protein [Oligoflexus sp.]HET9235915.1 hypothetical protein [Oligoflexus sp.]